MRSVKRKTYTLFTNKALLYLILPIVVESALSMSLGLIDGVMASHAKADAGEDILAAITQVDQISNLLIQLFQAFGTGGAILASQLIGANKVDEANKSAKQLAVLMLVISLAVMGLCMGLNRPILQLFFGDQPEQTMSYASQYFMIMAASFPLLAVSNCCAALLRAQRKSVNTMVSGAISFVMNVIFNAVFIYGVQLEVIGVALGTLLARFFPAVIMLYLMTRKNNIIRLRIFEKFRFNAAHLKSVARLAVPSGIESSLFQLGKILVISFISIGIYNVLVGTDPLTGVAVYKNYQAAANSAAYNINSLSSIIGNGINTGILTVVGQAIGTGDLDQVKYYMRKMIILSYLGNALCVAVTWALSPVLLDYAYNITDQTRDYAWTCLCLCLAFQFVTYPLSFGLPAILKATSDVRYVMVAAIVSMLVFRVGLCYILTCEWAHAHLGALGLWIGMVADWVVRSLLFGGRLLSGRWKKSSGMIKEEEKSYAECSIMRHM